jgi:hypothetical protein
MVRKRVLTYPQRTVEHMAATDDACERATIKMGSFVNRACDLFPNEQNGLGGTSWLALHDWIKDSNGKGYNSLGKKQGNTDGECSALVTTATE